MNCTNHSNIMNCTKTHSYSAFDIELIILLVLFSILCFCGYKYYYTEEKKPNYPISNKLQFV